MKLYYHPASPNGRRAILVLRQLGLEAEEVIVDMANLKTPEFTALNPNQKIPTLVDGDFVLWESYAIMQYLASKKPDAGLLPQDERGRADVLRWQFWNVAHFGAAVGVYNWENFFKSLFGMGTPDANKLTAAAAELDRFAPILDAQLRGRRFVTGDTLTIADLSIASSLMFRAEAKVPLADYAEIIRWQESIEALDAWKATAPKFG